MEHTQVIHDIQKSLLAMQDLSYRDFQAKLMPTVKKETVIGVRTPQLRSFAKAFGKTAEAGEFLAQLPHTYYEENNLHGVFFHLSTTGRPAICSRCRYSENIWIN